MCFWNFTYPGFSGQSEDKVWRKLISMQMWVKNWPGFYLNYPFLWFFIHLADNFFRSVMAYIFPMNDCLNENYKLIKCTWKQPQCMQDAKWHTWKKWKECGKNNRIYRLSYPSCFVADLYEFKKLYTLSFLHKLPGLIFLWNTLYIVALLNFYMTICIKYSFHGFLYYFMRHLVSFWLHTIIYC